MWSGLRLSDGADRDLLNQVYDKEKEKADETDRLHKFANPCESGGRPHSHGNGRDSEGIQSLSYPVIVETEKKWYGGNGDGAETEFDNS